MKRAIAALLLALLLTVSCSAALAERVADEAGLLTAEQISALETRAAEISAKYSMDVVILTANGLGGKTPLNYAADVYDARGYGQGEARDGVMLVLSMEERDWAILTTGSAIDAFTDYGQEAITDDIVGYFSDGDYHGGFDRFLTDAEALMARWQAGDPADVGSPVKLKSVAERVGELAVYAVLISLVGTAVTMLVFKAGMRTAKPQRNARNYVREGSMRLDRSRDVFLYHTQTRVRREEESSSGSSGGSTTFTSSSGTEHGGSSGKF